MHRQLQQQCRTHAAARPAKGHRGVHPLSTQRPNGVSLPVRLSVPHLPRLSELSIEVGSTTPRPRSTTTFLRWHAIHCTATATWWVATDDSPRGDRVMLAVEEACSLVHLQVIISQYERRFQVNHWLAAVLRLPELVSADGEYDSFTQVQRLLLSFEARTYPALPTLSAPNLISTLATYSALSYTPSPQWLATAVAHLLPRLDALSPASLTSLITSLARLQFSDCAAWQVMHEAAAAAVPALTSQQVASLAMALATIACDNTTLMTALSAKVADDLSHLTPPEISQLAASFADIGERSPKFWRAVGDASAARLSAFAPADVATLMRAFATAGHHHGPLFSGVASAVLSELRTYTPVSSAPSSPSGPGASYGGSRQRGFDVGALGDVMAAFKALRVHNVALLTAIVRHVGVRASGMRAASIGNEDLQRWVSFVQKQHSDYFMYGFFLSVATGVVLDQMLGATLSFVAAWWVLLRPMITDAAANAYVQYLTRKDAPWGNVWASILFNVEDAFRSPVSSGRW